MSDRTTALLFATMFEHLADPDLLMTDPVQARKLAHKLWNLMRDYDFSPYQMYCDESLIKLGLARRVPDSYDPHGHEIEYGPVDFRK